MDKLNAFIKTGLSWVEKIFHLLTEWINTLGSFDYLLISLVFFISLFIYLITKSIKGKKSIKKNKSTVSKNFLDRVKGIDLELSAPAISSKNKKKMGANKLEKEKKMQLEALQELLEGNFINEKQYNLKAEEIKKQT